MLECIECIGDLMVIPMEWNHNAKDTGMSTERTVSGQGEMDKVHSVSTPKSFECSLSRWMTT